MTDYEYAKLEELKQQLRDDGTVRFDDRRWDEARGICDVAERKRILWLMSLAEAEI